MSQMTLFLGLFLLRFGWPGGLALEEEEDAGTN